MTSSPAESRTKWTRNTPRIMRRALPKGRRRHPIRARQPLRNGGDPGRSLRAPCLPTRRRWPPRPRGCWIAGRSQDVGERLRGALRGIGGFFERVTCSSARSASAMSRAENPVACLHFSSRSHHASSVRSAIDHSLSAGCPHRPSCRVVTVVAPCSPMTPHSGLQHGFRAVSSGCLAPHPGQVRPAESLSVRRSSTTACAP
jgi:hypothetical protein